MGGGCGLPGGRRSGGRPPKEKNVQLDGTDRMNVASNGPVVRENNSVVPLSVEAEEFSLATILNVRVPAEEGSDSSGSCIPSREMLEGIVGRGGLWFQLQPGLGRRPRP